MAQMSNCEIPASGDRIVESVAVLPSQHLTVELGDKLKLLWLREHLRALKLGFRLASRPHAGVIRVPWQEQLSSTFFTVLRVLPSSLRRSR